jgi:hypothetical protein
MMTVAIGEMALRRSCRPHAGANGRGGNRLLRIAIVAISSSSPGAQPCCAPFPFSPARADDSRLAYPTTSDRYGVAAFNEMTPQVLGA